jgi:predicted dithiol-disulfide oxidoreductase (DUF899 family)
MSAVHSEVARLESQILGLKQELAALRRSLPPTVLPDFIFDSVGGPVALSSLFGESSDLILIANMGKGCAYCTLWADGFNGLVPELESRAPFVLVSADPVETLVPFAKERGWRFRSVASPDPAFRTAVGMVGEEGDPWPGALGLHKSPEGEIHLVAAANLGEGDDFCSAWHLYELLQDGFNGWSPNYRL